MNPIDSLFQRLRSSARKAFIPFITAGDPDLESTVLIARELTARGADLLEIGFPYSDPIADGPIIQASYTRALRRSLRVDDIFAMISRMATTIPLVGMVSYSLVHRRGPENFLCQAREAGLSGLIVPDLPLEESEQLAEQGAAHELRIILLVTPTTPPDRAMQIVRRSTGYVYCVSVAGITGERDRLPEELLGQLRWLRQQTYLPLCVGFGISKPEHVRMLRDAVDGVIVGSAFVRRLETAGARPFAEVLREIGDLAQSLIEPLGQD